MPYKQRVTGSNPVTPTKKIRQLRNKKADCLFLLYKRLYKHHSGFLKTANCCVPLPDFLTFTPPLKTFFMDPIPSNITDLNRQDSGINTIQTLAGIILVVGLILAVVAFFTMGLQSVPKNGYSNEKEIVFNWAGAITSVLVGFFAVIGSAICKVLATIAKALVQIVDNTSKSRE